MTSSNLRDGFKNVVLFGNSPAELSVDPDLRHRVDFRFARTAQELKQALPGAHALICWEAAAQPVRDALHHEDELAWIQWPFIGVDAILPSLKDKPKIVLTNASGVFDRPIAEYVLGLLLAMAKDLPSTLALQSRCEWRFRETESVDGRRALVVGVGGVGRAIAELLRAVGMQVAGVGRRARPGDGTFSEIVAAADISVMLPDADYVICAAPLTAETKGLFSAELIERMKATARFINVGRGELVDESALLAALQAGEIGAAALDVFATEPLPPESGLWRSSRVIVSPHMAGDVIDTPARLHELFSSNLTRFLNGQALNNRVDVSLGYISRS